MSYGNGCDNISIHVNAPALEQAINNLAAFLGGKSGLPTSDVTVQAPYSRPA